MLKSKKGCYMKENINAVYNYIKNFRDISNKKIFILAFAISVFISCVFYPGIFSADSLLQLEQAENHSYSTWHPAIMSILMHYTMPILGIGGIFVIHQLVYWIGIALIVNIFFKKNLILIDNCFFSPVFFTTLTVWKDAGMLSFCIFATGGNI